jgi:hypothetical protein
LVGFAGVAYVEPAMAAGWTTRLLPLSVATPLGAPRAVLGTYVLDRSGMIEVLSLELVPVTGHTPAAAAVVQMSVVVMVLVAVEASVLVAFGNTTTVGGISEGGIFDVAQSTLTHPQDPDPMASDRKRLPTITEAPNRRPKSRLT